MGNTPKGWMIRYEFILVCIYSRQFITELFILKMFNSYFAWNWRSMLYNNFENRNDNFRFKCRYYYETQQIQGRIKELVVIYYHLLDTNDANITKYKILWYINFLYEGKEFARYANKRNMYFLLIIVFFM